MLDIEFCDFNFRVLVHSQVLESLKHFRQTDFRSPEACGLLLGYVYGAGFEITDFTEPKSTDVRTRLGYRRNNVGHLEEAVALWEKSNGLIGYLGEWHTHPQSIPHPSNLDFRESMKIAKENACIGVSIILGNDAGCVYLTASSKQSQPEIFKF